MCDTQLEEADLVEISNCIGAFGWEMLAAALEVPQTEVETIKLDYRYSSREQIYHMLVYWRRNAQQPTFNTFYGVVKEYHCVTVEWARLRKLKSKIGKR